MIILKNLIIRFFYYLCHVFNLDNNTSRIICYHSISEKGNKYSVGLNQFKKEILEFKKYYTFVSLDQIVDSKKRKNIQRTIALTIDDGYKDVLAIVDFLKKNAVPASLFVMSNREKANRKELDHAGELLTNEEIKNLHKLGWTIGCHSATHADFNKLSKKEMEKEIIDSKKNLEKQLGFTINYFAYPKGLYSEEVITFVKRAGYEAAFTTVPAAINKKLNQYTLPRFVMEKTSNVFSIPFSFSYSTQLLRNFLH